jgi:hypothetical protein
MSQTVKTKEKSNKLSEIKIQKILNKIESLNLSYSYISQLKLPGKGNKGNKLFLWNSKIYSAVAIIVLALSISLKWFYNEWTTKVGNFRITNFFYKFNRNRDLDGPAVSALAVRKLSYVLNGQS